MVIDAKVTLLEPYGVVGPRIRVTVELLPPGGDCDELVIDPGCSRAAEASLRCAVRRAKYLLAVALHGPDAG